MSRAPLVRYLIFLTEIISVLAAGSSFVGADLPGVLAPRARTPSAEEAEIERQSICVGSTVRSAGTLGEVLFYRRARLPDGRRAIGYYVFYSDERPWGNNWLTWLLLPALAIDMVYTRALLIAPGVQRAAYGKGDVEGFRVIYDVDDAGHLEAVEALADDSRHRPAHLDRRDLFAIDRDHITVYTDAWSHQLGGKGKQSGDLVFRHCYGPGFIRPLTESVAREFHLERRATAAAVGTIEPDPLPSRAIARQSEERRTPSRF
jgi:hypothetical protein